MRVQFTKRITAGAVIMHEIDVYDIFGITLTASDSLSDIYDMVTDYGTFVKGHLEATQYDADGNGIYAELDGSQVFDFVTVEVFG
jgi:hypothetical protein